MWFCRYRKKKIELIILIRLKYSLIYNRFPKDPELKRRWILATKRKGFIPSKTSILCGAHFEESVYETGGLTRRLKKDAVPTLFDFPPHLKRNEPKKRRIIQKFMVIICFKFTLYFNYVFNNIISLPQVVKNNSSVTLSNTKYQLEINCKINLN